MGKTVCARVNITGRVQGVFFRAETQRAAEQMGINGWVRNRPDGTVEGFFEGSQDQVEQMIKWCWQGSPRSKVTDVRVTWLPCEEGLAGFSIRY